uniref:Predicted nucleic acid-binding protein, contains PIN domain n=1 Tax=Candidatus Kentrum sp. LFY TaxID=2126342 RepID=A0A450UXD5_9GAMM|nr:MAG: Predicted nucleic acid-binding protein, contains PIN domain [Candidatus Kentron sp. LFY]
MNLVVDTNILLAVALDEPERVNIIDLGLGFSAISPGILPYEIGNALTAMVKRGRLSESEAIAAFDITRTIPVRLIECNIRKALDIAMEFDIYAYDAYFLQCAQSTRSPLITLDGRMKTVAKNLNITVLDPS